MCELVQRSRWVETNAGGNTTAKNANVVCRTEYTAVRQR